MGTEKYNQKMLNLAITDLHSIHKQTPVIFQISECSTVTVLNSLINEHYGYTPEQYIIKIYNHIVLDNNKQIKWYGMVDMGNISILPHWPTHTRRTTRIPVFKWSTRGNGAFGYRKRVMSELELLSGLPEVVGVKIFSIQCVHVELKIPKDFPVYGERTLGVRVFFPDNYPFTLPIFRSCVPIHHPMCLLPSQILVLDIDVNISTYHLLAYFTIILVKLRTPCVEYGPHKNLKSLWTRSDEVIAGVRLNDKWLNSLQTHKIPERRCAVQNSIGLANEWPIVLSDLVCSYLHPKRFECCKCFV